MWEIPRGHEPHDAQLAQAFARVANDVASSIFDPIHCSERKRSRQIRNFRLRHHGVHNVSERTAIAPECGDDFGESCRFASHMADSGGALATPSFGFL